MADARVEEAVGEDIAMAESATATTTGNARDVTMIETETAASTLVD